MCCFDIWAIQQMIRLFWRRLADYLDLEIKINLRINCGFLNLSLRPAHDF